MITLKKAHIVLVLAPLPFSVFTLNAQKNHLKSITCKKKKKKQKGVAKRVNLWIIRVSDRKNEVFVEGFCVRNKINLQKQFYKIER